MISNCMIWYHYLSILVLLKLNELNTSGFQIFKHYIMVWRTNT